MQGMMTIPIAPIWQLIPGGLVASVCVWSLPTSIILIAWSGNRTISTRLRTDCCMSAADESLRSHRSVNFWDKAGPSGYRLLSESSNGNQGWLGQYGQTSVSWDWSDSSSGFNSLLDGMEETQSPLCTSNWVRRHLSSMPLDRDASRQIPATGSPKATRIDLFSGASAPRSMRKSYGSNANLHCLGTISWTPYLLQY